VRFTLRPLYLWGKRQVLIPNSLVAQSEVYSLFLLIYTVSCTSDVEIRNAEGILMAKYTKRLLKPRRSEKKLVLRKAGV
jgi:hypothetical protein